LLARLAVQGIGLMHPQRWFESSASISATAGRRQTNPRKEPDMDETLDATKLAEQEPIMRFFAYDHLPPKLQEVSSPFAFLATKIMELPRSAERTVALRKLLESKDAAVRASL
jgi:hypothetical protein